MIAFLACLFVIGGSRDEFPFVEPEAGLRALTLLARDPQQKPVLDRVDKETIYHFSLLGWGHLNNTPYVPYPAKNSFVNHNELVPPSVEVLSVFLRSDTVSSHSAGLAATCLAMVNTPEAKEQGLPLIVRALATHTSATNFYDEWMMTRAIVTLCKPEKVAGKLSALMISHSNPSVRAAAATVLGMRHSFMGNAPIHKVTEKKYRYEPIVEQIDRDFILTIPLLAKVAATDGDYRVRRSALATLSNATQYTQDMGHIEPLPGDLWYKPFPFLAQVLVDSRSDVDQKRSALQTFAGLRVSPVSVLPTIRPFLDSKDDVERYCAGVTVAHIALNGKRDALREMFENEARSTDPQKRKMAFAQWSYAATTLWGYGNIDDLHPRDFESKLQDRFASAELALRPDGGNYYVVTRKLSSSLGERKKRERQIDTLTQVGLRDADAQTRASAAKAILRVARAVDTAHGLETNAADTDIPLLQAALKSAVAATAKDDPTLHKELTDTLHRWETGIRLRF
ncbi:MAG: hypothetical protein H7Y38_16780 [Armatimonadetes bacterium]|nr:hypothetical protein [Armatimonadota bacterium]